MTSTTGALEVQAAGGTDVGLTRATNQDAVLIDEALGLYLVADGMGGHAGGEIASQLCAQGIQAFIAQHQRPIEQHPAPEVSELLREAVNHASLKIYERALEDPQLRGMGTTVSLALMRDRWAYFAHVGDSRAYILRCGLLYQLSFDHSLVNEQVRAGLISAEEAEGHHLRNVITRSVGYQEAEEVDTFQLELFADDTILLCTDGLHGKIEDSELAEVISASDPQSGVSRMIALANERGGQDNITALLVRVHS